MVSTNGIDSFRLNRFKFGVGSSERIDSLWRIDSINELILSNSDSCFYWTGGNSDSNSKKKWNHNTSKMYITQKWQYSWIKGGPTKSTSSQPVDGTPCTFDPISQLWNKPLVSCWSYMWKVTVTSLPRNEKEQGSQCVGPRSQTYSKCLARQRTRCSCSHPKVLAQAQGEEKWSCFRRNSRNWK